MKKISFVILFSLLPSMFILGQARNYWSVSFNSEASLLAGAVVGGNSDITSIYYNPAGIAEIEDKKFAINANLFNLSYTRYKNALGTGLNLAYLGFTVQPRFISYVFKLKKTKKLLWQFAIFNRNNRLVSVYDQIEKPVRMINPSVAENYTGNLDFVNDYIDSWGGLGLAYKISKNFTIGASFLVSIKNFTYMKLITINLRPVVESLPDTVELYSASSSSYEKIKFYDVRVVGKFGLRYHSNQFGFGLNVSFPSFRIMGNSDVKRTITNAGMFEYNGQLVDDYFNEAGKYLNSGFRDPLSVSFGLKYSDLSSINSFYFTTEYFYKLNTYKAIDGTQVVNNKYEPSTNFLSYKLGAKSIMNFAAGWQYKASEKFEFLFGFRTNFDPYSVSNDGEFNNMNEFTNPSANLYHFTAGSKFNYKKISVIAGLEYVKGKKNGLPEFVNFSEPDIRPGSVLALAGENNNNMVYAYNAFGFTFGFTFGI